MRFAYLKDPLFLACVMLYFVNRLVFKHIWAGGFPHTHLNDLICIPFWVPIMLWLQRKVKLRWTDDIPSASEIVLPVMIWAMVFEILLPQARTFHGITTADPVDVVCYALGGLMAAVFWAWWYRPGNRAGQPRLGTPGRRGWEREGGRGSNDQ